MTIHFKEGGKIPGLHPHTAGSARSLRQEYGLRHLAYGIAAVTCVSIGAGCSRQASKSDAQKIIGKWLVKAPDSQTSVAGNIVLDFRTDGTVTQDVSVHGQVMTLHSTYKLEKGMLTEVLQTVNISGAGSMKGTGQTETFLYILNGNNLTLSKPSKNATILLTRVPS